MSNNELTVNVLSVAYLMKGMDDYMYGTDGITTEAVKVFADDVQASATVLSVWNDLYNSDPVQFEIVVCCMYGNLSGVDEQTLANTYRDRIRSRLRAIADMNNQPYKVPKADKDGYNGYSLKLAGSRKANKGPAKWTKGMDVTASNIKKATKTRKDELLATMLIKAGLTSATLASVKAAMVKIEKASNK